MLTYHVVLTWADGTKEAVDVEHFCPDSNHLTLRLSHDVLLGVPFRRLKKWQAWPIDAPGYRNTFGITAADDHVCGYDD